MKIGLDKIHKLSSEYLSQGEDLSWRLWLFLLISQFISSIFFLSSLVLLEEIKEWMIYPRWVIQRLSILIPFNQSTMGFEINILTLFCFLVWFKSIVCYMVKYIVSLFSHEKLVIMYRKWGQFLKVCDFSLIMD